MKYWFLFNCLFCVAFTLQAEETSTQMHPSDFAYGMSLEVDGDGAIYGLSVPQEVYQTVIRPDLGDLRVFNSRSVVVPHQVRRQDNREVFKQPPRALTFFPIKSEKSDHSWSGKMRVTTDSHGAIIDISGTRKPAGESVTKAYLLDLGDKQQPRPDWLSFEWQGAPESFVTNLSIESSNDLNRWQMLVAKETLAGLQYGGHLLKRSILNLPSNNARYLRLSWPAGEKGVELTEVMAGYDDQFRDRNRQWSQFPGAEIDSKKPSRRAFMFKLDGFYPIDRIRINTGQTNSMSVTTLFSRASEDQNWFPRWTGLIYDLQLEEGNFKSGNIHVALNSDRYWRLELNRDGIPPESQPQLEAGWIPDQLLFIAQGDAPFRLAFGSAAVGPAKNNITQLLHSLARDRDSQRSIIKQAKAGVQSELGGRARLTLPTQLHWQRWILWAILLMGVVAIGYMAKRLFHEMNNRE